MIRLVAERGPVDIAWDAFDAAAIMLNRMYAEVDPKSDTADERAARCEAAQQVAHLWQEWQALFLGASVSPVPAT
jgi:TorA maturation chaperone TorD